jgi:hypothetical protein
MAPSKSYRFLQIALVAFGAVMICLYPMAVVWPSGWAWHAGAPHESDYFMMIVGVYLTLGAFLWNAARRPEANISLIWFTVVSSLVHAVIMTFQSFGGLTISMSQSALDRLDRGLANLSVGLVVVIRTRNDS